MSRSCRASCGFLLAVASACGGDGVPAAFVVRDSAGVAIATIHAPAGSAPVLGAQPLLEIGRRDDAIARLYDVRGAGRLSDGRIIIADGGSRELRVFDAEGRGVQTIGGPGAGPGEFASLDALQVLSGDTVLAFDVDQRRITLFTVEGDVAAVFDLGAGSGLPRAARARAGDGSFIVVWDSDALGASRSGRTARGRAAFVRYAPDGTLLDTLAIAAAAEVAVRGPAISYPLMGRNLSYAVAANRLYIGTQETYEIRAYDLDGNLTRMFRRPGVDLTVRREHIDSFTAFLLRRVGDNRAAHDAIRAQIEATPVAPALPAYGRFVLDAEGMLWVSEATTPVRLPVRWSVIDPERGWLGDVNVPQRFEIFRIGTDFVLGRWFDPNGIEIVQLYPLTRNRGTR